MSGGTFTLHPCYNFHYIPFEGQQKYSSVKIVLWVQSKFSLGQYAQVFFYLIMLEDPPQPGATQEEKS